MGVMTRFKASAEVCVCLVKVSLGFLSVSTTEYLESGIGEVFLWALLSWGIYEFFPVFLMKHQKSSFFNQIDKYSSMMSKNQSTEPLVEPI